jgi:tetratricopeptide (TPR) repeat protein
MPASRSGLTTDSASRRRRSNKAKGKGKHRGANGIARLGTFLGLGLLAFVVAAAPLATGAVHRSTALGAFALTLVALGLVVTNELGSGVPIRFSFTAAVACLVFVLLPFVESLPLPAALANRLDPAAADLIGVSNAFRPLSLDPPATWLCLGQAAAAMATVIISAHVMSGRSSRYLLLRAIVVSGIASVVVGVGHRILGEDRIYGIYPGSRGILNGPFINPNHTAEFLELAFFASLALALAKSSVINRVGWIAAGVFVAAGAVGTLSRGGVLGLGISTALFVGFYPRTQQAEGEIRPPRRRTWLSFALVAAVCALVALSLGASQILAKFSQSSLSQEMRFQLWRDSLKLLFAHPLGIGRGAFDRAYPTVRTLEVPISARFSLVENEPLQFLIDTGWLGELAIVVCLALLVRQIWKFRRADKVELALGCGLVAALVHSVVDFGLETLGVLLPFSVLLGSLLGRTKEWSGRRLRKRHAVIVASVAGSGLLFGVIALARPASADFDARLRGTTTLAERRAVMLHAEAAHPFDYYYFLQQGATEPLIQADTRRSPRMAVLNRALLLCPNCPEVHAEIGRSLWSLGKRQQALNEWTTAMSTRPVLTSFILEEAWRSGARPEEMATLARGDSDRLIRIANLLLSKSNRSGARKVLDFVPMGPGTSTDALLLRAELDLEDGKPDLANQDLAQLDRAGANQPRAFLLRAELALRAGDLNRALDILDQGAAVDPYDLSLQDRRVQVIMSAQKWSRAQPAIEGLETALFHAGASTASVHNARARLAAAMGESKAAITEFRAAINQDSHNAGLWMNLAQYYESISRNDDALKAMQEAQDQAPQNSDIAAAIKRMNDHKAQLEETARSRMLLLGR